MSRFLNVVLATWRLTNLLTYENGPGNVFARVRAASRHIKSLDGLFDCFWCVSVWAGFVAALLTGGRKGWLVRALAASAGAIIIDDTRSKLYSP